MKITRSDLTYYDLKVGDHVKVVSECVDFNFFRGETGVIERCDNPYLGIIVLFDAPRSFKSNTDGATWEQERFNFHPYNLELLPEPEEPEIETTEQHLETRVSNKEYEITAAIIIALAGMCAALPWKIVDVVHSYLFSDEEATAIKAIIKRMSDVSE